MLAYANKAVLPFYLLHQTVIPFVGWSVIPWDMAMLPKFLIMALYEPLIRHLNIVRFFFDIRPKKKSLTVSNPRPEKTAA